MRYLNSAVLLAVIASAAAYACGGDSGSVSSAPGGTGGEAGSITPGGSAGKGDTTGGGGSTGKGGTTAGGSAGQGGTAAGDGGAPTGGQAGESTEGGAGGEQATTGSLTITVSGVPDGQATSVTITGPGGFTQAVASTTTLSNLQPGTYTAVAAPASFLVSGTQVDSIVDASITGSGTVASGATANIAATYSQRPGTGALWAANDGSRNVYGFAGAELATTGAQVSAASFPIAVPNIGTGGATPDALAFTANGDMWLGYCRTSQVPQVLAKISGTKLGSPSPTPDVVITLPATDSTYDCVEGLAFDPAGNLWAAMYRGHVLRIDAADLQTSGTPTPSVSIGGTKFITLQDILFDANGNLYVAPFVGGLVLRLSASQLTTSNASLTPAVVLTLPSGAGAAGFAIGGDGSLWVSDYNHGTVIKYNASDVGATGTPTPALTVGAVGESTTGPQQLAFDKTGNLWVAAYNNSTIYAFAAADLATGGTKAPLTTLTGADQLNGPFGLRFNSPSTL